MIGNDFSTIQGAISGWDGSERRSLDRRAHSAGGGGEPMVELRKLERRRFQFCHVCGKQFQPTPAQKQVCPDCRSGALRMDAPAGRFRGN